MARVYPQAATEKMIPRHTYFGKPLGAQPTNEAEHFIRCPTCGGWIDCRDLEAKCSTTKGHCHTHRRINRNDEQPHHAPDRASIYMEPAQRRHYWPAQTQVAWRKSKIGRHLLSRANAKQCCRPRAPRFTNSFGWPDAMPGFAG
jgi:hypothetical protein